MVDKLIGQNARNAMDQQEYRAQYENLVQRCYMAKDELRHVTKGLDDKQGRRIEINLFIENLNKQPEHVEEFQPGLWFTLINQATVKLDGTITYTFQDGTEI